MWLYYNMCWAIGLCLCLFSFLSFLLQIIQVQSILYISFVLHKWVELVHLTVWNSSNLQDNAKLLQIYNFTPPFAVWKNYNWSISFLTLNYWQASKFPVNVLNVKWYHIMVLICISLINEVKPCKFSVKGLFRSFSIGFVAFFLLKLFIYCAYRILVVIYVTNIFSQFILLNFLKRYLSNYNFCFVNFSLYFCRFLLYIFWSHITEYIQIENCIFLVNWKHSL